MILFNVFKDIVEVRDALLTSDAYANTFNED